MKENKRVQDHSEASQAATLRQQGWTKSHDALEFLSSVWKQ